MVYSLNLKTIFNIGVVLLYLLPIITFAQNNDRNLIISVDKTLKHIQSQNIISTVVKIQNDSVKEFQGFINIPEIKGLRNIAKNTIPIKILPSDSLFFPVKFLVQPNMPAGETPVLFNILDLENNIVNSKQSSFVIEERTSLSLATDENNLFITNQKDSIYVKTTVANSGNKVQKVTVVFSIPSLQSGVNFVEQTAQIEPMTQHKFVLGLLPTKGLLEQQQFAVNISAMRGQKKELFGNSTVNIRNILTERPYVENTSGADQFMEVHNNAITAGYKILDGTNRSLQLIGAGNIDLPAGYMTASGNIYKSTTDDQIVATNTFVKYKLNQNELTIGNIYESLETTISGRGARILLSDRDNRSVQVGVIDENYNFFSKTALFSQGYSAYAIGKIKDIFQTMQLSSSLIHQYDSRERSLNNVLGGDVSWLKNGWELGIKIHGATSSSIDEKLRKYSGASEFNYRGKIKDYNLSGIYYLSSAYFPGNRRGMLYLQQSFYKEFSSKYSMRVNAFYSAFSPKSFSASMNSSSSYFNGDIELFTPKIKHVFASIGYQAKYESSNSYKQSNYEIVNISSNRMKETIRWNIPNTKHSMYFVQENGVVSYPNKKKKLQLKSSISYAYDWFNLISSYQSGSFYLSEYYLSQRENKPFERFILSASVNKRIFDEKCAVNGGVSVVNDPFSKFSVSAYSNARYTLSKWTSLFINSTWNSYKLGQTTKQVYSIELGLTVNLPSRKLSSKRKSKLSTFVFYDNNSNRTFDVGDKEAKNYNVRINNVAFRSAQNGMIIYKGVPYGSYSVDPVSENGWFFDGDTIQVDRRKAMALVPLQQAGTVTGRVKYVYEKKLAVDFTPQLLGISFNILTVTDRKSVLKVSTNDEGVFTAFLPTGEYVIQLDQTTLPQGTYCNNPEQTITISSGRIINLHNFEIGVRRKTINMKYFTQ